MKHHLRKKQFATISSVLLFSLALTKNPLLAQEIDPATGLPVDVAAAAAHEAARIEAERIAYEQEVIRQQEEAARIAQEQEAARLAQEAEAARLEAERVAQEAETARIAQQEEALRLEAERLAQEAEAARIEAERIEREAAEQRAREEAIRVEAEKVAQEQEAARVEAERLAQEAEAARIVHQEEEARRAEQQEALRLEAERIAHEQQTQPSKPNYNLNIQNHRENILRSLKQFAALELQHASLMNPAFIDRLKEALGLADFKADAKNFEELLDSLAVVISKNLDEYIGYLVALKTLVDNSTSREQCDIAKINVNLKRLWQESKLVSTSESVGSWTASTVLLAEGIISWPRIYQAIYLGYKAHTLKSMDQTDATLEYKQTRKDALNEFIFVGLASTVTGVFLGVISSYLQKNIGSIPMTYDSEAIQTLYKKLAMASGLEEILNASLTLSKHRELCAQLSGLTGTATQA